MKRLLVVLVVLLGVLAVADRVGAHLAENALAEQLARQGDLPSEPAVAIGGFPFLTQVVGGTYDDVRVRLTAEQLRQPADTSADATFHGVHVPLSDLLGGQVTEVPVDRVDGRATFPFALIATQLGSDATVRRAGDGLQVTRTVQVAGLQVPLTGTGTVRLDGGDVVVTVQRVSVAGLEVPSFVLAQVQGQLDLRYPVPALPFGLQVTRLTVTDDGVRADARAVDTVLR